MDSTPIIVISSSKPQAGKTTLALNLAAALWSDLFKVKLFAPDNPEVDEFLRQRNLLRQTGCALPLPELIARSELSASAGDKKEVIIADIPTVDNEKYADVFAAAHTLITVGTSGEDLQWSFEHPYMQLIWQTKKSVAARGVKYLNWIALLNKVENDDALKEMTDCPRRFGYRLAEPLHYRESFRYVRNGYCAADMACFRNVFKMSMPDVYARREILTLTDFLWQGK